MNRIEKENMIPVWKRAAITLEEASAYSGIGTRKLIQLSDDPDCDFVLWVGCRRMFKRKKLTEFLENADSI